MELEEIVPYGSIFIDCYLSDIIQATKCCFSHYTDNERQNIKTEISSLFETVENPNRSLPCYSVRTGFDLFLSCKNFLPGSEVLMTAINVPDMVRIVRHHKLKPVPIDIDIDTTSIDLSILEKSITHKSVALVVAHIFGKRIDVTPFLSIIKSCNLVLIEDCAESFCGFAQLGHPDSDLSLLSFGTLKTCTSFGGAIVKVKDEELYYEMAARYTNYSMHMPSEYFKKLQKCLFIYLIINVPCVSKRGMELTRKLNVNHQKYVVQMLRGFTSQDLIGNIRKQPTTALLATMLVRLKSFDIERHRKDQEKVKYVISRLPENIKAVGTLAGTDNNWLFPVITEDPSKVVSILKQLGIDAYNGSTQLDVILPEDYQTHSADLLQKDSTTSKLSDQYPHRGKYLIGHAIYLPVHKRVPYKFLNKICLALHIVSAQQKLSKTEYRAKL